jgi:hypothetical protein
MKQEMNNCVFILIIINVRLPTRKAHERTMDYTHYIVIIPPIQNGFTIKWCQTFYVLCETSVPQKLNDKFYKTVIQPVMLYGAEYWSTKKRHVQ